MRPRSDDAHFATDYVPQLRQFIEAGATQPSAKASNAWVFLEFEERALALVFGAEFFLARIRVNTHRAEFEAAESIAFLADAIGDVEDGTRRIEADQKRQQQEERRQQDESKSCKNNVEGTLHCETDGGNRLPLEIHDRETANGMKRSAPAQSIVEVRKKFYT